MSDKELEKLYQEMLEELQTFDNLMDEAGKSLGQSLGCIQRTLEKLFDYFESHSPATIQSEIHFFKYVKPRFLSWQIYLIQQNYLVVSMPVGTDDMSKNFLLEELSSISRFFQKHAFLYQYYLAGETMRDEEFFLRKNISEFPLGQEFVSGRMRKYSTQMDYMFAQFKAMEMLRDFIISRVKFFTQTFKEDMLSAALKQSRRYWSGDKAELVELIYGIYLTRRLNNGRAEIGEIIDWFEETLNVDLRQAYRIFMDIKRRKKISYTKFLDEMTIAIRMNIEEGNR